MTYVVGGYSLDGSYAFGYVSDLFRVTASLVTIAYFAKVDLRQIFVFQGFINIQDRLNKKKSLNLSGWFVLSGLFILAASFVALPIIRHRGFGSYFWDMTVMDQVIWRKAFGYGLTSTAISGNSNPPLNFLLHQHLNFWLFPTAGLYRLFPATETLLILQSLALLLTFIPLWKISKELSPKWAPVCLLPLLYWCMQTIHKNNIWDIHENCYLPMVSLWAYYFFLKKRWIPVALCTLAVALFKEDAWVVAGAMAFYFFSSQKKWFFAILSFLVGFGIYASYGIFFNKINSISQSYSYLGNNFSETLPILAKNPFVFIQHLLTPGPLKFLGGTLLLSGGLWLFGGWTIVAIIPTFFEYALSTKPPMYSFDYHYAIAFLGPLLFAAAKGLNKIDSFKLTLFQKKGILVLAVAIAFSQLTFSEPVAIKNYLVSSNWQERECFQKLIDQIPTDAPVYGMDPLISHLAKRPLVFAYPTFIPGFLPHSWMAVPEGTKLPDDFEIVKISCGLMIASNRKL